MPVCEYRCLNCGKVSPFLVKSLITEFFPECPECASKNMKKMFSQGHIMSKGSQALECGNKACPAQPQCPGNTCCGA